MNLLKKILAVTLLFSSSITLADSVVCPLGKKEDHLTIQRVMLNFGKYTMEADAIAIKDMTPQQDVTDIQLTKAINDLSFAQACADAVIANPTGDLLPAGATALQVPQREKLVKDLVMFMKAFSDGITDYQTALVDVLNTPEADRNYHEVYLNYQSLNNLVTRAHRETSFDMSEGVHEKSFNGTDKENTNIKNPMEQIGENFSQIKKTITQPANNAANAKAAREIAVLFSQVIGLIPDAILNLPSEQRAVAMADYQKMIQQEIDLSTQLALAFEKNDNTSAVTIVKQMNSLKMEGHDRYDP